MKPLLTRTQLTSRRSRAMTGERPYVASEIQAQLAELPAWRLEGGSLQRAFVFRDFHQTMAFVNALAWVVHGEDHHPEITIEYNRCVVRWHTHSTGGISENDFICAAKTDAVFGRQTS